MSNFRATSKIKRSDGSTRGKKGYSSLFAKYAGMSLCCTGLQEQVKSAYWNLFTYAKQQFWTGQEGIVRSQSTPRGFSRFVSDCFERTVHLEWAPRRLIAGSTPTRVRKWTLDLSDFWDLVKLVHRKKPISCSWIATHLGNYKIQKNRKDK